MQYATRSKVSDKRLALSGDGVAQSGRRRRSVWPVVAVRSRMLPNGDLAYIDDAKLRSYLLSRAHTTGRGKAGFLHAAGFDLEDVQAVRDALLAQARTNPVADAQKTAYGLKFRIDGPLFSPTGVVVRVRTVWHVDTGQIAPRFVTMRPL